VKRYDAIIFDLDGTLWDASQASSKGWNAALKTYGIVPSVSPDDIRRVSGKPFAACVETVFSHSLVADTAQVVRALESSERSCVEADGGGAYEGVLDGIQLLASHYSLFLVSNCQHWYLESFWKHVPLQRFFMGWDCHGRCGASKAEMIKGIVHGHEFGEPIYIGDTAGDQQASDAAGVDFGYASYGFGCTVDPTVTFASFGGLVAWFWSPISAQIRIR